MSEMCGHCVHWDKERRDADDWAFCLKHTVDGQEVKVMRRSDFLPCHYFEKRAKDEKGSH